MMYLFVKRFLDLLLSIIGLLVLIPILVITVIAIKLESKGPVFFIQKRLGQNGNVFWIIKFRSMKTGAEKGGVYSDKNDVRVTKVGKFIRATSIDELPQLFNIIKGEMSIVGPRPTLTYHPWPLDQYTSEQRKRFNVKPGVTGWAQINGRKELMWDQRLILDVEYVNNLSFFMDLKILFVTFFKVFSMKNNVNIGETAFKH